MYKRCRPFSLVGPGRQTLVFYKEDQEQLPYSWQKLDQIGRIEYMNDFHLAMLILACLRISENPEATFNDLTDADEVFYLGLMYLRNELETRDPDLAVNLLRRAADGGNKDAAALIEAWDKNDPPLLEYD